MLNFDNIPLFCFNTINNCSTALSSPDLFPSSCQGLPLAPGPQYLGAAGNTLCRIQDFLGEKTRKRVNESRKEKALLSGACQGLCTWIYLQQIWRERRKTTKKQKCSSLWQHGNQNMYTKNKKRRRKTVYILPSAMLMVDAWTSNLGTGEIGESLYL